MAELRRPSLRLAMGLAVGIVGLVEVQNLVQTLRSQARMRDRVVRGVREAAEAARPRLALALRPGDAASWQDAAQEALTSSLATEIEVFDPSGKRLLVYPSMAPVEHWPTASELDRLRSGDIVSFGPLAGEVWRVLTYVPLGRADHAVILRLSTPVPELAEEVWERRQLLIAHALALVVLVLAGGLVLLPAEKRSELQSAAALEAYETAMERLRDRGRQVSVEHEAERRRLEDRLQDRDALARAGELTAGIVHEVRNGLGTIVGYARLLERTASPPDALDAARRIREECETLEAVVRRFMEFARRETLDQAPFDLARMLTRVAARESQGRRGVDVTLELPDAAPVVGDEGLLERAFENLVRNACEAAGPGGKVHVGLAADGRDRIVTIADDGPGLSAEAREKLRPFHSTKAGGLGLGLPIAVKVIGLHGGSLEFVDAMPRGLQVRVRLPIGERSGSSRVGGGTIAPAVTDSSVQLRWHR